MITFASVPLNALKYFKHTALTLQSKLSTTTYFTFDADLISAKSRFSFSQEQNLG